MLNAGEPSPQWAGGGEPPEDRRLADFDADVALFAARVLPAYRAGAGWLERTRAGLLALLDLCEQRPELAKRVLLDSIAGGPAVLKRRAQLLDVLAEALDRGREQVEPARVPAPQTAENLVGACVSLLQTRLMSEPGCAFGELAPALMSTIVHPYLGPRAARRELEHSPSLSATETAAHRAQRPLARIGAELGELEPKSTSSPIRSASY